jgi:hypothetical protein
MTKLFCVELGVNQQNNLCRVTASIIVMATTTADAASYLERRCPEVLRRAEIQRIFEAEHVFVDWPNGEVAIVEL